MKSYTKLYVPAFHEERTEHTKHPPSKTPIAPAVYTQCKMTQPLPSSSYFFTIFHRSFISRTARTTRRITATSNLHNARIHATIAPKLAPRYPLPHRLSTWPFLPDLHQSADHNARHPAHSGGSSSAIPGPNIHRRDSRPFRALLRPNHGGNTASFARCIGLDDSSSDDIYSQKSVVSVPDERGDRGGR